MSMSATARLLALLLLSSVALGCAGDAVTEEPDAGELVRRSAARRVVRPGSGGSSGGGAMGAAGATERPAPSVGWCERNSGHRGNERHRGHERHGGPSGRGHRRNHGRRRNHRAQVEPTGTGGAAGAAGRGGAWGGAAGRGGTGGTTGAAGAAGRGGAGGTAGASGAAGRGGAGTAGRGRGSRRQGRLGGQRWQRRRASQHHDLDRRRLDRDDLCRRATPTATTASASRAGARRWASTSRSQVTINNQAIGGRSVAFFMWSVAQGQRGQLPVRRRSGQPPVSAGRDRQPRRHLAVGADQERHEGRRLPAHPVRHQRRDAYLPALRVSSPTSRPTSASWPTPPGPRARRRSS